MKRVKKNIFFLSVFGLLLFSCEPSGSYVEYTVYLNISTWNLPDTATVSVPFNIDLTSVNDNSCVNSINFIIEGIDAGNCKVYAQAIYENHGQECNLIDEVKDTTLTGSYSQIGKFYFYIWNEYEWKMDSIIIIP